MRPQSTSSEIFLAQLRTASRSTSVKRASLVTRTGQGQANVSKHLQQLHAQGFVSRRRAGLFAFYRLADRQVMRLCAQMLDRTDDGAGLVAERSAPG